MNDAEKESRAKLNDLCQRVIDAQDSASLLIAIRELNDYLNTIRGGADRSSVAN